MSVITPTNKVRGTLEVDGLPDNIEYSTLKDFFDLLQRHVIVEIPDSITNVVVSNVQPTDSQRDSIWFRRSNSGSYLGAYVYSQGKWQQFFPAPDSVYWMYGDSRNVKPGYRLINESSQDVTPTVRDWIMSNYLRSEDDTHFTYFATVFVGL